MVIKLPCHNSLWIGLRISISCWDPFKHFFIRHVWPKPHCTRLARRSKLVAETRPWSKNSPTWTRDWTKRHYRWMLTSKMSTSGTSSHLLLHSSLWEAFGLQLGRPFNDCQLRMPNPTIQRFRIGFPNRFEVSFGITVSVVLHCRGTTLWPRPHAARHWHVHHHSALAKQHLLHPRFLCRQCHAS